MLSTTKLPALDCNSIVQYEYGSQLSVLEPDLWQLTRGVIEAGVMLSTQPETQQTTDHGLATPYFPNS